MRPLPWAVRAEVFVRSLFIQSGWNYRTMIGTGMAFAIDPVLRYLRGREVEGEDTERQGLHASHFNAHPYLASAALGSLARMEAEGESAENIARFRSAVRGPLGAMGDRLVWATWLPLTALVALAVLWAGATPAAAVLVFLGLYNGLHLALRVWGFRTGWAAGPALGGRLKKARFPEVTARLERLLPVALGLAAGVVLGSGAGVDAGRAATVLAGLIGLTVGAVVGAKAWKPTAGFVVIVTLGTFLWAWMGQV